ncbi:MAG: glycoside hydrolase family 9 protein [Bacteroidetes bacterium]|nr:glycoside hydrolase family 9 protein [Bacteroidota bacterium]
MKKIIQYALPIAIIFCNCTHILFAQTIDNHIKVDQFGYLPGAQKICVISNPITGFNAGQAFIPSLEYKVRRVWDNQTIYTGNVVSWKNGITHSQSGDKAWWFNFSGVTECGKFYIYDSIQNKRSYEFEISPCVYNEALKMSQRTFYYQRCGVVKDSIHVGQWKDLACHNHSNQFTQCRLVTNPILSTQKDLSGGWHDAGDYNKYVNFAFNTVHDLLSAYEQNPGVWSDDYNIPESGNGIPDLLDEIKFELDWILKMQDSITGAVLTKAGTSFNSASPASADLSADYYGAASTSATLTAASMLAHAAKVYQPINSTYSLKLKTRATLAWQWASANPNVQFSNSGCTNVSGEYDNDYTYHKLMVKIAAACYLYAATADTTYRTFFNSNYTQVHLMQWTFAYPFESSYQEMLLYYTKISGATTTVKNNILNTYHTAMTTNGADNLQAFMDSTDAYRAFMQSYDYTWGNNMHKCYKGIMFGNMNAYQLDTLNKLNFYRAASGMLHYIHGINPLAMVHLSNMYNHGAENSANEFYHGWFADGTPYDNALTSLYGPPPGFLPGGANPNYAPDATYGGTISPPQNQPTQKSYKDWNTSWPQNSWEITENAIYSQAAYSRLVSQYACAVCTSPAAIAGPASVCNSSSATYSVTSAMAGTTYNWCVTNGYISNGQGTNTITVNWTNGSSGVVTIYKQEPNSGVAIGKITITIISNVAITNSGNNTICIGLGQTRILTAPVYSGAAYQWLKGGVPIVNATTNTLTVTSSGNYKVSVSFNGCTKTSNSIGIKTAKRPSSSIGAPGGSNICGGASPTLQCINTNQTGLGFQWMRNATNIPGAIANSYTATVTGAYQLVTNTSSGCTRSSSVINVTESSIPPINPAGTINFCAGDSVLLSTANGGGYVYQWKHNGNDIPGATQWLQYFSQNGNYKVVVTDNSGCTLTSSTTILNINCKLKQAVTPSAIAYPNPFTNEIIIELGLEVAMVLILDNTGREIEKNLPLSSTIKKGKNLSPGVYIIKINYYDKTEQLRVVKL